jgi:leucyl aminopeptidase (aminopeptidase T)
MNRSSRLDVAVGVLALSVAASLAPARATAPDYKSAAQTIVGQCAEVKSGDRVLISGTPNCQAVLEEIAVNCRKAGAFPFINVASEQLQRRMVEEVPAKYDSQTNDVDLKLLDVFNVQISVEAPETEGLMAGVDPKRLAARSAAAQPVVEAALKSPTRQLSLGNALYPTALRARRNRVSLEQLSTIFWSAVNADYPKLHNTGEQVKARLAAGGEVHLTNPNGTDLRFKLDKPNVLVSDGVLSPEKQAQGGVAAWVWVPAGEVYTAPLAGTAEGKAVIDRSFFAGKEITGLTLTFSHGKLIDMTAKSGVEGLKALYDASGEGKDNFAFIDLGINQSIVIPEGVTLLACMPAGMVYIGIGDSTWAGGDVRSNFSFSGFLPGSTVTVAGKVLVENGQLRQ